MFRKLLIGIILCFILVSPKFSVSATYWIFNFRSPLEKSTTENVTEKSNETDFSQQLHDNNPDNTTENNILFVTVSDMNSTLKPDLEFQTETEANLATEDEITSTEYEILDTTLTTTSENTLIEQQPLLPTEMDQINKGNEIHEPLFDAPVVSESKLDEKIVLNRNNCYLEIFVHEGQDLKVEIEFQKLENNTSGKCCITLSAQMNNLLGVVISNIHLYQNDSQGEVIKVIIADYGSEYVLKEYYSRSMYQPLLLTETNKVYIVLYYEVKNVPLNEQNSHFNLEVFNYHKYENFIPNSYQSHISNNFATTEPPFFYK